MNFNSKAKLLLWLYLPKILSPIPLTALIIITVLTQATAGTNTNQPLSGAKKIHESGSNFAAEVIKIQGKVTDEKVHHCRMSA